MNRKEDFRGREIMAADPTAPTQEYAVEGTKTHKEDEEDIVMIAGQDSFPASDSPAWTLGREPRND
jgi:hypothetical protein